MNKILAILGVLTISLSSTNLLFFSNFAKNNIILKNFINQNNFEIDEYESLQKWGENINNKSNIISEFESAIYLDENWIKIDINMLKDIQFKKVINIYKKITININVLYKLGLKNNELKNIKTFIINIEKNTLDISQFSSGFSAEFKWYWFGWGKLKFDNNLSKKMVQITSNLSEASAIASAIADWFPGTALVVVTFSLFCLINSSIFSSYNKGNGVWIGTIGWLVYDVGWGSL